MCVCVRACVRACMRACVCVYAACMVCVCMCVYLMMTSCMYVRMTNKMVCAVYFQHVYSHNAMCVQCARMINAVNTLQCIQDCV